MTLNDLRSDARFRSNTNSTTYPDADVDRNINRYYHEAIGEILSVSDNWERFLVRTDYNLSANVQSYALNVADMTIVRVEVTYDGTNWSRAVPFDIRMREKATDTTSIGNDFSTSNPFYDLEGNSIYLYPIPTSNITNGLRVWTTREATNLSLTTDEPNIVEPYQHFLSIGAALAYLVANPNPERTTSIAQLRADLELLRQKIRSFYGFRQQDMTYRLTPKYENYK